ncbi:MAG: LytR/AlgR family response regulator transcription factor [Chitinophagaceae bacterium]
MKLLIADGDVQQSEWLKSRICSTSVVFAEVVLARTPSEIQRIFLQGVPEVMLLFTGRQSLCNFDVFKYIQISGCVLIVVSDNPWDAVEAIKLKAIDFFLAPYEAEDLEYAIEKAASLASVRDHEATEDTIVRSVSGDIIVVWDKDRVLPIDVGDIVKIKSSGAYSDIYLENEKHYVSAKNLGVFEEILKQRNFVRIHHSCLVNLGHIKYYNPGNKAYVTLSDSKIEYVSKRKKKDLLRFFNAD